VIFFFLVGLDSVPVSSLLSNGFILVGVNFVGVVMVDCVGDGMGMKGFDVLLVLSSPLFYMFLGVSSSLGYRR